MPKTILFILFCTFAATSALVGTTCKTETDCDAGECCQILSEFMVVSKRQVLTAPKLEQAEKTGTCQMYKIQGAYCNGFDKMNGYCSCAPGLRCYTREEPLPSVQPRSMLMPKPGFQWVSTCEKP